MLVIFQNKIIFMPGLPPNSRWEKIEDYAKQCAGIQWREERVRASDGKELALCVADIDIGQPEQTRNIDLAFYVLYFQGMHVSLYSGSRCGLSYQDAHNLSRKCSVYTASAP